MSRESTLAILIADLTDAANADFISREEFTSLFSRTVRVLQLEIDDVVRICKISRLTTERWLAGSSTPHRFVRALVFLTLCNVAKAQADNRS